MGRLLPAHLSQFGSFSSVKPLAFYNLSLAVAPVVTSDAERRRVVSLIYYGLHHEACCRFFRVNSQTPYLRKDGTRHKDLINKYRNAPRNRHSRRIGDLLDELRRLRTTADYDLNAMTFNRRPITEAALLLTAMQKGKSLLNALDQFSPGEAQDGCQCVSP